jgi:hypothetical protein
MPYITCPDGKTYSRYDQSEYVQNCICEQEAAEKKEFQECMQDPTCKKEYEQHQQNMTTLTIVCLSVSIISFLILSRIMFKHLTN